MGHIRLGRLPKTRQWRHVFDALASDTPSAERLARAIAESARARFEQVQDDSSINYCVWVLVRTLTAARDTDFQDELARVGLRQIRFDSPLSFVASIAHSVDREVHHSVHDHLFGQIAQASLREVLTTVFQGSAEPLFGGGAAHVQSAINKFSSDHQIAVVLRQYFAKVTSRAIKFIADKEAGNHVGQTNGLQTPRDVERLWSDVDRYCYEVSRIVEDFAQGWVSKANFKNNRDIPLSTTASFTSYAIEKIIMELREVQL